MVGTTASVITSDGDIEVNIASFERHLRAANLSPTTIKTYREAASLLARFLRDRGMPRDVASIRREHVEAFITEQLERWKPATAMNRYRGCQSFFKWLIDEGEIKESPMAKMRGPRVPGGAASRAAGRAAESVARHVREGGHV